MPEPNGYSEDKKLISFRLKQLEDSQDAMRKEFSDGQSQIMTQLKTMEAGLDKKISVVVDSKLLKHIEECPLIPNQLQDIEIELKEKKPFYKKKSVQIAAIIGTGLGTAIVTVLKLLFGVGL